MSTARTYIIANHSLRGGEPQHFVLTIPAICKHPNATLSIGPTTDQRNYWCPDCKQAWTTFPTDAERAEALRQSFDRHMAQRSQAQSGDGSPSSYRARPDGQDLNPASVKDISASASPATKEQQ